MQFVLILKPKTDVVRESGLNGNRNADLHMLVDVLNQYQGWKPPCDFRKYAPSNSFGISCFTGIRVHSCYAARPFTGASISRVRCQV